MPAAEVTHVIARRVISFFNSFISSEIKGNICFADEKLSQLLKFSSIETL
jgi:hypothetical protein